MTFQRPNLIGPDVRINDSEELQKYGYRFDKLPTSPTRIAGTDELGIPIEETLCAFAKSERFVDPAGNICVVPLQTGRVFSHEPEAERYEMQLRRELILTGWLPLRECPHTSDYRTMTGRAALVPVPDGVTPCEGKEHGCDHAWTMVEKRQALGRKRWESQQFTKETMTTEQALQLAHRLGEGMASKFDPVAVAKSARDAMKAGRGEKE